MKSRERQEQIIAYLLSKGNLRLAELRERFQVSEGTIRNDLRDLEAGGKLIRTHGGATLPKMRMVTNGFTAAGNSSPGHLTNDEQRHLEAHNMAHRAAELVNEDDAILLCSSAITQAMVDELLPMKHLTVLTNSFDIAQRLSHNPAHTVVLIGGQVHYNADAINGPIASGMLERMRVSKAFISCDGVSTTQGFASNEIADAQVKASMITCADSVIMLAPGTTIGRLALMSFAGLNQAHHLITTHEAPTDMLRALMSSGVRVSLCGERITEICADCPPDRKWRIGFSNLTEDQDFAIKVRESIEKAAQSLGVVDLVLTDNAAEPRIALENARRMLDANLDLMIEYQQDERTNYILMDMFRSARLPVIAIDIPMPGAVYFGADNYRAGRIAGEAAASWIREHWAGKLDKIVYLEQTESGSIPAARIQGTLDTLRAIIPIKDSDILHCDTHGGLEESRMAALNALRNIPWGKRVLFIGINANSAIGTLEAAETLGRQSCTAVVSQNASRRIRSELRRGNSMLIGAVDYFPEAYGDRILQMAMHLLAGKSVPPATYTDHALINAANVQRFYPNDPKEVTELFALPAAPSAQTVLIAAK